MGANILTLRNESNDPRRAFRAKRGDVRLAILDLLNAHGGTTGYGLMQLIKEKSDGIWRVSAGSVYPTLEKMETENIITSRYVNGNSKYLITKIGVDVLRSNLSNIERIWKFSDELDLGNLNPLEAELAKLSEAIELATRGGQKVTNKVFMDVVILRKRIFSYLAE